MKDEKSAMDYLDSFRKVDFDSADYDATNRIESVLAKNRLQEEPRGNSKFPFHRQNRDEAVTKPILSRLRPLIEPSQTPHKNPKTPNSLAAATPPLTQTILFLKIDSFRRIASNAKRFRFETVI